MAILHQLRSMATPDTYQLCLLLVGQVEQHHTVTYRNIVSTVKVDFYQSRC